MDEEVSDLDVKVSLPDKDIRELIITDRKAAGRRLAVLKKTHPKSEFHLTSPKREEQPCSQPPFVCVSPAQAKDIVKRPNSQMFISIGTPYEADRMDYVEDKSADAAKQQISPFRPSSFSQAKDSIKVDYFLNSPDMESKAAELRATRQRGTEMKISYVQQTKDLRREQA